MSKSKNDATAFRYAKAFFTDQQKNQSIIDDFSQIDIGFQSKELHFFVTNEHVKADRKIEVLKKVFNLQNQTLIFLDFLKFKKRLNLLPEIVSDFIKLVDQASKIKKLTITFRNQDEKIKSELVALLEKKWGYQFQTTIKTDPKIMGGFKYQIDDFIYDFSLAGKLSKLNKTFLS